jgi:hypothetical protein
MIARRVVKRPGVSGRGQIVWIATMPTDLFAYVGQSVGAARTTDPDTSHEAADSIDTTKLEQIVYQEIRKRGERGATWDELTDALPWLAKASISPRFVKLREKGLIEAKTEIVT